MLDTDASSYIIGRKRPELLAALYEHRDDLICISVISFMELRYGLLHNYSDRLRDRINAFLRQVDLMTWTRREATIASEIKHHLLSNGTPIGGMDMLIAASAISVGAELVTNNRKHFGIVPGLVIADWL